MEETARLESIMFYPHPHNSYNFLDDKGKSYFVTNVTDEDDCREMEIMFETINRQPESRFFLFGIGIATRDSTKYLVYENARPWASTTTADLRYRTREYLCGLYQLHHKMKACHRNFFYPDKSLVVSTSSGTGKLAGMIGCKNCSNKSGNRQQLCTAKNRKNDVKELVSYIGQKFSHISDIEFDRFLDSVLESLERWVSVPGEVIYYHPIWIAHPRYRLFSRSILNKHFQMFIDSVLSDRNKKTFDKLARFCDHWYGNGCVEWRQLIESKPSLANVYNHDVNKGLGDEHTVEHTAEDKGTCSRTASKVIRDRQLIRGVRQFARFARNVCEHHIADEETSEESLEAVMASFRTFMFSAMIHFKTDFEDWKLETLT